MHEGRNAHTDGPETCRKVHNCSHVNAWGCCHTRSRFIMKYLSNLNDSRQKLTAYLTSIAAAGCVLMVSLNVFLHHTKLAGSY